MQAMGAPMNASRFLITAVLLHAGPAFAGGTAKTTTVPNVSKSDQSLVKPVDIKAHEGKPVVLTNAASGEFVVAFPGASDRDLFFGTEKAMFQQRRQGSATDGDNWTIDTIAPRVKDFRPASIIRRDASTFDQFCGSDKVGDLKPLSDADAAAFLAKAKFYSSAVVRVPEILARNEKAIYYYVDRISKDLGGAGYRVFVGKKGAMKQLPLVDVANDEAGMVFATKNGELRLVTDSDNKRVATWTQKSKRNPLTRLDTDASTYLIYRELGIYSFLGTLCDSL
jgi:hypothetical protein